MRAASLLGFGLRVRAVARRHPWSLLTIVGLLPWLVVIAVSPIDRAWDAYAYAHADLVNLYGGTDGVGGAFLYSPAIAQLLQPLQGLSWPVFAESWRLLELGALAVLAGPFTGPLFLIGPIRDEVIFGNINLVLPVLVLTGLRWPALWSGVVLTKVSPGVGLVWFVARREWRSLTTAIGVTAAIALISTMLAPGLWTGWFAMLTAPTVSPVGMPIGVVPLPVRVLLSATVIAWGARTDRRWTLVIGAWFALPILWPATLAWLVPLPLIAFRAVSREAWGSRLESSAYGRSTTFSRITTALRTLKTLRPG